MKSIRGEMLSDKKSNVRMVAVETSRHSGDTYTLALSKGGGNAEELAHLMAQGVRTFKKQDGTYEGRIVTELSGLKIED